MSKKEYEYWVYIMASTSGTLYTGMTNNIYRRVSEHKKGQVEGFSGKYKCTKLVHSEYFTDVHSAIVREKRIKGWIRKKKQELISKQNPGWQDLSKDWF